MKKTVRHICFLLAFLAFAQTSQAQISIERSEFPRMQGFVDTVIRANPTGITAPSEGPGQLWDYSSLVKAQLLADTFFSAAGNTDYPDALNYQKSQLAFQAFTIPYLNYEEVDNLGWFQPGWKITDVTYSIQAITGGPNDSLRFVGGKVDLDYYDMIQFPLEYQADWVQTREERIDFKLSIAAYGFNKTPGYRNRENTQHRKVVGHGQLIIPGFDGMPSAPMNVLLIKVVRSTRDSVFLGENPAPEPILDAFGIVQGAMAADSFYVFYRQNFAATVLNINYFGNGGFTAFYRPQSLDVVAAAHDVKLMETVCAPNPVRAGTALTLQTEMPVSNGVFQLTSLEGRLLYFTNCSADADNQFQLKLPESTLQGMYFYQLYDEKGGLVGTGKLIVQ